MADKMLGFMDIERRLMRKTAHTLRTTLGAFASAPVSSKLRKP
jgi:hypothetical protein